MSSGYLRRSINYAFQRVAQWSRPEDRHYCMDCGKEVGLAVKIWEPGTGKDRRLLGEICSGCAKVRIERLEEDSDE